ncbi:MAG: ATP-binding protein [Actinomycetota bacterium]
MVPKRTFRRVGWAAVVLVAFQAAWLSVGLGGEAATTALTDLMGLFASSAAAVAAAYTASRTTGPTRSAWRRMSVALMAYAIGDAIWTTYEVGFGREVPFPSVADAGYLAFYPLAAIAIVKFPGAPQRATTRVRATLDGLIIAASVLFVGWSLVIGAAFDASDGRVLDQAISIAYPVADVVLISLVLYAVGRSDRRDWKMFALIGGGLGLIAMADFVFTYLDLNDLYASGALIDPLWTGGMFMIGLGALMRSASVASTSDERRVSPTTVGLPYIAFSVAIVCAIWIQITRGSLPPFAFWSAVANMTFIASRQYVALRDNISLNRDLDRRVQERTADLETVLAEREDAFRKMLEVRQHAEDTLRRALEAEQQAANELREADEMRSAFLMAISHELRTPLTTVLGFAEMLEESFDEYSPDEIRTSIDAIACQAQRLERLLSDLLDVDRLSRGVIEPRLADADIADVVQGVIARTGPERGIAAVVDERLRARLDPALTERILENLVVNAIKHTQTDSNIVVSASRCGDQLEFAVADDGPGIADDLKCLIFQPFEQAVVPQHSPGTGIGLALVERFSALQGGRAWVEDRAGGGSVFRVEIPFIDASGESAAA